MKGRRTSEDANTDLKDEKGLLKVQIGQVEDIANSPSPSPSPSPSSKPRQGKNVQPTKMPSL